MVFNRPARGLITGDYPLDVFFHDWWAYQIISGCGGWLIYDPDPSVRYRQHGVNLVGRNRGLAARWTRFKSLFSGVLKRYLEINLKALNRMVSRLTPENRRALENLVELRRLKNPFRRLRLFLSGGFYRQSRLEQAAAYLAVLLGKI